MLVHTRKWCEGVAQGECAFSTVRRTVWDGDQTLYEIQMEDSDAWRENDTQRSRLSYNSPAGFDPNPQVGRVLLTHGPGIDQPLSVVRMNYGDTYVGSSHVEWPTFTVFPIWNHRGRAPYVIFSNGGRTLPHPAGQVQLGTVWRLAKEAYGPAANAEVTSNDGMHQVWLSSVMEDQQDASGLLYRRNRYYDPATGRFTQEDPIGLAGGLNLYGFAAGDPVSYSDPYGLSPDTIPEPLQEKLGDDLCGNRPGALPDCNQANIVTSGAFHSLVMRISGGRVVTLGNNIYSPRSFNPNSKADVALLAHEVTHVGEYQMLAADGRANQYYQHGLMARIHEQLGGNPYDWRRVGRPFAESNGNAFEARGQVVEDCFLGVASACSASPYKPPATP